MHTDLILVRHGQSQSNVEGRFCAVPPGPGLTQRGRLQAAAATRCLLQAGVRPSLIVSSPLARARETARPLEEATGLTAEVSWALREVDFGPWEGMRFEELSSFDQFRSWCVDPEAFPPPGGERLSDVADRVLGLFGQLGSQHPSGTIVGFSHMHPLVALLIASQGRSLGGHGGLHLPNATIVHARIEDGVLRFISLDTTPADAGEAIAL
jgi:probable phosphoglycerate mutase